MSIGGTVIISLERTRYTVSEASSNVEVCVVLNGLGVEGVITVGIFTESNTATGKPTLTMQLGSMYITFNTLLKCLNGVLYKMNRVCCY